MCYRKSKNLGEHRSRFTIEMAIQSSNDFAERERERALNVRDSRKESKTNIQRDRERDW